MVLFFLIKKSKQISQAGSAKKFNWLKILKQDGFPEI